LVLNFDHWLLSGQRALVDIPVQKQVNQAGRRFASLQPRYFGGRDAA
jgi:hypothetical protein